MEINGEINRKKKQGNTLKNKQGNKKGNRFKNKQGNRQGNKQ